MCGFIGIASHHPIVNADWFSAGLQRLHHRGPDSEGLWWSPDHHVVLGHRRLSIIDLSPDANQPMQDSRGELSIAFNGEVYNYLDLRKELMAKGITFRSKSDTEVLLAAYREWGTNCLSRINGMFSFALYDGRSQNLFMARDRAGEKPLFYSLKNGQIRFASELKGLMADPTFNRRIQPEALDCYLAEGFVPGDLCILEGVNKLPPAHALVFNIQTGEKRIWRYWDLGTENSTSSFNEHDLLAEFEVLLEDAVRRQLIADVPVGILLSGGVDSSLVTAMAVRAKPHVKTFTIRFPGHGPYDETSHARLIASHFGTDHTELEAEANTIDLLPMLAKQFDEPVIDSSMIPTHLVSRLIRQHCTVALGGDGGDELFGGYGHYNRQLWLHQKLRHIPLPLRRLASTFAEYGLPLGLRGRNWLWTVGCNFNEGLPRTASFFDRRYRSQLLGRSFPKVGAAEKILRDRIPETKDLLHRSTLMDFGNYLAEDILVKVDRASMLNSLEVRAPLLDYRIIEFAYGKVPSHLKATPHARKILPKKLTQKLLPPAFDQHRKQGFSIPLSSWIKSKSWQNYFREALLDNDQTLFNHRVVNRLLNSHRWGRANGERLFGLLIFELWRREYNAHL